MFNKTILNIVKNYFLKIDHEICGIIKKVKSNDKEVVILEIHPPIIEDDKRLNCSHVYYSKIIFHTHPNISKPYPSAEDILKIMKSFDIEYSVIFTSWGIWKLYSNKKFKFTEKNVKNDIKKINSLLVDLYYHYKDKNFDFLFINEVVNKIRLTTSIENRLK